MIKHVDNRWLRCLLAASFILSLSGCGSTTAFQAVTPTTPTQTGYASASTRQWLTEFASTGAPALVANQASAPTDVLGAMAGDLSGGFVTAGYTLGTYPSFSNTSGAAQAVVAKYDSSGSRQWLTQFGTGSGDFLFGVAMDSLENSFAVGATNGTYPGQASSQGGQALVVKLDKSGNRVWSSEFNLGSGYTSLNAVSTDGAGVPYVVGGFTPIGTTGTVYSFVAQLDGNTGHMQWMQKFGAANIITNLSGLAVGASGDVYVVGTNLTATSASQSTANVERLSASTGGLIWNRDLQTSLAGAYLLSSVVVPADGQPVVAGAYSSSNSVTVGFGADASASGLITKLSAATGTTTWQVKPTSGAGDEITSVVAIADVLYATGSTNGALSSNYAAQLEGNFLLKLDGSGSVTWVQQFGTGRIVNVQTPYGLRTATDGKSIFVGGPTQTPYPGFPGNGLIQIFLSSWAN